MKNTVITLAAACALGLASCGGNTDSNTLTQEQLDSVKAAFDDSVRNALKLQNDSIALAEAQRAADSLQAALDSAEAASKKKVTTVTQKQTSKPATQAKPSEEVNSAVVAEPVKNEGSTSSRPGAKNQVKAESATNSQEVKSTSNRPGAK